MKKLLLNLLLLWTILLTTTYAQEKPQAVIIFDASGSMWGQIDGKAKIIIAKDALNSVVKEWNSEVELGLTAYGHRKKGDCNDIESLVPVGAVDKDKIISLVKKIQPKGKTPIARSLKKVAEELKFTEEKATIILISDGKENCDANPCEVAKELEKKGIDFVTHVIGFNVDKKTDKQLECIADATGGEYFSAKNATALNDAIKTIVTKVEKIVPIPKPTPKKLKNNLEITASETEGGKWIEAYIEAIKDCGGEILKNNYRTGEEEAQSFRFPVGKYRIDISYNKFKKKNIPFEIKADEVTKLHIIFSPTNKIEISASETEGGKWIEAYIDAIRNSEGETLENGYRTGEKEAQILRFPVGQYTIDMSYNKLKKKNIPFEIKEGEVTKLNVVMGETGVVEITASEKEGGEWINAYIDEIKKDGEVVISEYETYSKKPHDFRLPIGKYSLNMTYNKFKKKDIPFEIKAGEVTKLNVVMGETGVVEITASEKEEGTWIGAYIDRIKKDGEVVLSAYETYPKKPHDFRLPVGKYTLDISYKKFKKKDIPFKIKAGKVSKLHISFAPFHLAVKGTHNCSMIEHEVISATGRLVREKKSPAHKGVDFVLPNGTYFIESTVHGVTKETTIVIGGAKNKKGTVVDFSLFP
jgi:Ca-activated chloride channel family protein